MEGTDFSIPTALLGQAFLFLLFIIIVNAVLKETARIVVRVALVVGLGLAVAVIAGWLEKSLVLAWLEQVGEWLIIGIRAVVLWLRDAWVAVTAD